MTKRARVDEVVLAQLRVHERDGTLPTTGRFLFYELEGMGQACKPSPDDLRPNKRRSIGWPPGSQDITDSLTRLRDSGAIPWDWIVDTERSAAIFTHAPSVAAYMRERLEEATINPFAGPPPLILCEDRGTAEVLESTAGAYSCPIAGTKGHANGFLRTVIVPRLLTDDDGWERDVIYLGDRDRSGEDVETNTYNVLREAAPGWGGTWRRLALTATQVERLSLTPMYKRDGRDGQVREAWELQALGQLALERLLRAELDALLPEPLSDVLERERLERDRIRRLLGDDA